MHNKQMHNKAISRFILQKLLMFLDFKRYYDNEKVPTFQNFIL